MLGSLRVLRDVRSDHTLVSMFVLGGLGSFFIGTSLQTRCHCSPTTSSRQRRHRLRDPAVRHGAGGVSRVLLEATGSIQPNTKAAVVSTAVYGVTTLFFAFTAATDRPGAAVRRRGRQPGLDVDGQTIVQLRAAPPTGGRVIGLYGAVRQRLRAGSGFTVASSARPSASSLTRIQLRPCA